MFPDHLDFVPIGKLKGKTKLALMVENGALPHSEIQGHITSLPPAGGDLGSISYPDLHILRRNKLHGKEVRRRLSQARLGSCDASILFG